MNTSTANVCQAMTKDGQPCRAFAVEGSKFCFWHDPELAAARRVARSAGGRARHGRSLQGGQGVRIECLGDVLELVSVTIGDVVALENSVARGRCLGYLAGVAVRALEAGELEDRIARLEAEIGG